MKNANGKRQLNIGYRIIQPPMDAAAWLVFRPKVIGRDRIPRKGAAILAANHKHAVDPVLVLYSTPRIVRFLAKKEIFETPFRWLFRIMRCIKVDRDVHDGAAMREAISRLNDGELIGIFPEGTRNRTRDQILQPFHFGTVAMARKTGAPIVPAVITGDYNPFKRNLSITFGEPFFVPEGKNLVEANRELMDRMEAIWRESLARTGRTEKEELKSRKLKRTGGN